MRLSPAQLAAALLVASVGASAQAQVALPKAKPVPRMQVVPQPHGQAAVTRDGRELTRYHFGPALRRPFLFPLVGPAGRSLTRMGHPHDPEGHSHHNSVWISHHDVGGVTFWGDRGANAGRIVHGRVEKYIDGQDAAAIETHNAWVAPDGKKLLDEFRRLTFAPLEGGEWMLTIDLKLTAVNEPVVLGKTPFGILGVRMAKTIGVSDGGGLVRNSEGGVNEEGVFWKQARWMDYSGPITPQAHEGVTLMDHPSNPNHPTYFHVRNDGWMGSSLTFDAPRTLEPDAPLELRYGLYIHAGAPEAEKIEARYKQFAEQFGGVQ